VPIPLGPNEYEAFRNNLAPPPHLDLMTAVGFRAVGAALRLDVFETLASGPASATDVAAKLGLDGLGVQQLAELLVATGYLTRGGDQGDRYANSPITERWLLRGVPGSYAPTATLWQDLLFGLWDSLETSLRQGRPAADFYPWLATRPDAHAAFDTMLAGQAGWLAAEIVDLVEVPAGATRLLDVGGGHAGYTTAFCGAHPGLSATIVDLPAALEAGQRAVAAANLADRVRLVAGDWSDADFGTGQDVVLLFNVLHGNGPEQNTALLGKVAGALASGGVAVILDHLAGAMPPDPDLGSDEAFVAMFSLNLFHTQGGRLYPTGEINGWLGEAGLSTPTWTPLRRLPSLHVGVTRLNRAEPAR
jgi:hypothetical protein